MLLLGTSPGRRGAKGVLKIAKDAFPYYGGNIIANFSLPQFRVNFDENEIKDENLSKDLNQKIELFQNAI